MRSNDFDLHSVAMMQERGFCVLNLTHKLPDGLWITLNSLVGSDKRRNSTLEKMSTTRTSQPFEERIFFPFTENTDIGKHTFRFLSQTYS